MAAIETGLLCFIIFKEHSFRVKATNKKMYAFIPLLWSSCRKRLSLKNANYFFLLAQNAEVMLAG